MPTEAKPSALAAQDVDGIRVYSHSPLRPIDEATPHPDNPNQGDVGALTEMIREHGFRGAIEVQHSTGRITAGEHRWRAARDLGMTRIPMDRVEMDDDEALRRCVSDNRARDLALYDEVRQADVMRMLATSDRGLAGTGWDGDDLDDFFASIDRDSGLGGPSEASPVNEPPAPYDALKELRAKWGTVSGQVWMIAGQQQHRLLIGDASGADGPDKLLAGEPIDLIVSSPPYNVGVKYASDGEADWTDAEPWPKYRDFLVGCMAPWVAHLAPGRYVVWNISSHPGSFPGRQQAMMEDQLGLMYEREVIWLKTGPSIPTWQMTEKAMKARAFYPHRMHEIIYLFTKGKRSIGGPIEAVDPLFRFDTPTINATNASRDVPSTEVDNGATRQELKTRNAAHPAVFPAALPAGFATHLADVGAVVFDPFLGAATTILACEQRARRGFGTEVDPGYAAVALERLSAAGLTVTLGG